MSFNELCTVETDTANKNRFKWLWKIYDAAVLRTHNLNEFLFHTLVYGSSISARYKNQHHNESRSRWVHDSVCLIVTGNWLFNNKCRTLV